MGMEEGQQLSAWAGGGSVGLGVHVLGIPGVQESQVLEPGLNVSMRTDPASIRGAFPCSKWPCVCQRLSETLVPASGLHGRARKLADACKMA